MPTITFKCKLVRTFDEPPLLLVKIPKKITRKHCDMAAFRRSKRYGYYANSDMFESMIAHDLRSLGIHPGSSYPIPTENPPETLYPAPKLPPCVTVDDSGFLATVTIKMEG